MMRRYWWQEEVNGYHVTYRFMQPYCDFFWNYLIQKLKPGSESPQQKAYFEHPPIWLGAFLKKSTHPSDTEIICTMLCQFVTFAVQPNIVFVEVVISGACYKLMVPCSPDVGNLTWQITNLLAAAGVGGDSDRDAKRYNQDNRCWCKELLAI